MSGSRFAKAGRSASLRDGWRASFDIQAFIQEQLLGGSWLVSSLVGMPIGMARTNTVYPHMVHHVFVLFPLPRRHKRGMTCPQDKSCLGKSKNSQARPHTCPITNHARRTLAARTRHSRARWQL
jgi:hypothetical protein